MHDSPKLRPFDGARRQLQRRNLFRDTDCTAGAIGAALARKEIGKIEQQMARREEIGRCADALIKSIGDYAAAAHGSPEESGKQSLVGPLRKAYAEASRKLVELQRNSFCCPSCTTINTPGSRACVGCEGDLRESLANEEESFLLVFTNPYAFVPCELPPTAENALHAVLSDSVRSVMAIACGEVVCKTLDTFLMVAVSFAYGTLAGQKPSETVASLAKAQKAYEAAVGELGKHVSRVSCTGCGTSQPNLLDSCSLCGVDFDRHGRRPLAGADHFIIEDFRKSRACYQKALESAAKLLPEESRRALRALCERNRQGAPAADLVAEIEAGIAPRP